MAIFELLPATIGMNECEMALWPHWPVHAALMYIAFWLFYALDRIISVVGSNQQDHRQTINGKFIISITLIYTVINIYR